MAKSTLDEDDNNALLAVFKGESGVGKTVGALSFPNPYVLDLDRKMPSIARKHFPEKNIEYDSFASVLELDARVKELKVSCPYQTIIVDSFTGLGSLCFSTMASIKSEEGAAVLNKLSTKAGEKIGLDYYFGENHYIGNFIDDMKKIHRKFNVHVIITAHVIQYEPISYGREKKELTALRPILAQGRKPAAILPTEVDNVFIFGFERDNTFDRKVRRMCYTVTVGDDAAKCSFPFEEAIDFTNSSLYDKLFAVRELEEEEEAIQNEGL